MTKKNYLQKERAFAWKDTFKTKPFYTQSENPSCVKAVLDISEFVKNAEIPSDKSSDNGEFQAIN